MKHDRGMMKHRRRRRRNPSHATALARAHPVALAFGALTGVGGAIRTSPATNLAASVLGAVLLGAYGGGGLAAFAFGYLLLRAGRSGAGLMMPALPPSSAEPTGAPPLPPGATAP